MKGKKILSLVSLAMGVAIVGGTFAAWAVTDNADPFGIKVSPGSVGPDTTQFVTLSYGSSTFANVDNLEAGVPRIAGSVLLKADTNDGSAFPYAMFDIALQDQSNGKEAGDAKLVNLLNVDVYDVQVKVNASNQVVGMDDKAVTPIGHIPTEDEELETSIAVTIPSGTGKMVYVVVSLDGDTDAKTLEEIASDVVYLQMDLNKSETTPIASTSKIYFAYDSGKTVNVYAWGAKNKNADWPGVAMHDEGNGYYSYDLKVDFDHVIFSEPGATEGADPVMQTIDLEIGADQRGETPTFKLNLGPEESGKWGGSWVAAPDPEIVVGYYVVGDKKGNWSPAKANLMTVDAGNEKHYSVDLALEAGELLKVTNQNKTVWFSSVSTWDGCGFTIDASGNIVVTTAGNYTVNLYTEGDGGNCVTLTPKASA